MVARPRSSMILAESNFYAKKKKNSNNEQPSSCTHIVKRSVTSDIQVKMSTLYTNGL